MLYLTAPAIGTQLMTLVPSPPPPGTSVVGDSDGTSRASRTSTAGRNVQRLPFLVLFLVDSNNLFRIARPPPVGMLQIHGPGVAEKRHDSQPLERGRIGVSSA